VRSPFPVRRRALRGVLAIAGLALAGACEFDAGPNEERWGVVQDYLDRQAAWEERAGDLQSILMANRSVEEGLRSAEEEHGAMPDATAAVDAAQAILAAGGPRTIEAAEFLLERSRSPLALEPEPQGAAVEAPEDRAERRRAANDAIWTSLIDHVDADWEVVQAYLDEQSAWFARLREESQGGGGVRPADDAPSAIRAVAAARAILNADEHSQTVEAAEFLMEQGARTPGADRHVVAGARALLAHAPDHEEWPSLLRSLDGTRNFFRDGGESIGELLEEMASDAEDPVLRASAHYYVAAGLVRGANDLESSAEDRAGRRERALAAATGLSVGVEGETFDRQPSFSEGVAPASRTFAQAEADLIDIVRHATVGGTLPELTGRRLDGTEEPLSAYRGRVVLIDFWATWCVPCIAALPELRDLVAELPAERFALLAVSVDQQLATITDFMASEPMPWPNWHAGLQSDVERRLAVRAFPTYLLADEEGVILANGFGPLPRLRCMAERALAGEDPYGCTPADWMPGFPPGPAGAQGASEG